MEANDQLIAELNRRLVDDKQDAERLIQRIVVPEDSPGVVKSSSMKMDWTLLQVGIIDRSAERDGMRANNAAIRPAREADDKVTDELLERILLMEEGHLNSAEQRSDLMELTQRQNVVANRTAYEAA